MSSRLSTQRKEVAVFLPQTAGKNVNQPRRRLVSSLYSVNFKTRSKQVVLSRRIPWVLSRLNRMTTPTTSRISVFHVSEQKNQIKKYKMTKFMFICYCKICFTI